MNATERQAWILEYLYQKNNMFGRVHQTDILDNSFVTDYAEATNSPVAEQFFGAPKCPQLGKDLSYLYNEGKLNRVAVGIGDGLSSQGFPKWVYSYSTKWLHRM